MSLCLVGCGPGAIIFVGAGVAPVLVSIAVSPSPGVLYLT